MTKVLFVCLGNICRSPMAACLFRQMIKEAGCAAQFAVDSAGTQRAASPSGLRCPPRDGIIW